MTLKRSGFKRKTPAAYAKAHPLLLEDDGERLVLWAPESIALPADRAPGRIIGEGPDAVPELVRLLQHEAKVL